MTLVGPRPETPALAVAYPLHCRWIFSYRPGLTGPSQVRMRDSDVLGPNVSDPIDGYLRRVVPHVRGLRRDIWRAHPSRPR